MKRFLFVIACLVMSTGSIASADVVFDADTTNTTLSNNAIGLAGTLTGSPGDLNLQNNGSGFNITALLSTDDINTLNGATLTDLDTVTATITVSGLSVGELRANGIEFGLQSAIDNPISNSQSGDLVVRAEASNSGGDIGTFFDGGAFDDSGEGGSTNTATITDGFTITLDADVDGYTFTLESIGATSPVEISGAFTGTQFVDIVGGGRFYYAQQQFNPANNGVNLLGNITQASVHVTTAAVPEPSSLALLAIGAVGICVRRRR